MTSRISTLILLAAAALLAGCNDDPAQPKTDRTKNIWTAVDLGLEEGDLRLLSVAASGDHVAAVGWWESPEGGKDASGNSILFRLQPDGSWSHEAPAPGPPTTTWMDLFLDAQGRVVLAGFKSPGSLNGGCILDTRGGDEIQVSFPSLGMLTISGDGGLLVAGGASRGGELWTSRTVNAWSVSVLPLTGTNDSGFQDVAVRGDVSVACGYDDGADQLAVILQRVGQGDWLHVPLPKTQFFGRTLEAIALAPDGAIYVGGIAGAGGLLPAAFLSIRSAGGDWADIALPDPTSMGGIEDILLAADGSIYLTSGTESLDGKARILRAYADQITLEITPFAGRLFELAQTADGTVYAAGWRTDQGLFTRPVLLRRDP